MKNKKENPLFQTTPLTSKSLAQALDWSLSKEETAELDDIIRELEDALIRARNHA